MREIKGASGLYPMIGDFVIYRDHTGLPRFGVITKIFGKNKVNVKTRHFKVIEEKEMHIKRSPSSIGNQKTRGTSPNILIRKITNTVIR